MKKIIAIFCCLLFIGCAGKNVTHHTPSRKVETTIMSTDTETIIGMITDNMINRGYSTKEISDRFIIFEQPVKNILGAALFGSRYDSSPNTRITYNINCYNKKTRIVASFAVVTNPGSAFERISNFDNHQDTPKYQSMLNKIKIKMERK